MVEMLEEIPEEISEEEFKKKYQEIVDTTRPPLCIPRTVWVPTVRCVDNGCRRRGGRCIKVRVQYPYPHVRCYCVLLSPVPTVPTPLPTETPVTLGNQPEFPQVNTQQGCECPSFTGGIASGAGFVLGATAVTVTAVGLYKLLKK